MKGEKLLTPQQVANRLNIKRSSIWRYIRNKKLKVVKLTERTYRISEQELNKFLKQQSK